MRMVAMDNGKKHQKMDKSAAIRYKSYHWTGLAMRNKTNTCASLEGWLAVYSWWSKMNNGKPRNKEWDGSKGRGIF